MKNLLLLFSMVLMTSLVSANPVKEVVWEKDYEVSYNVDVLDTLDESPVIVFEENSIKNYDFIVFEKQFSFEESFYGIYIENHEILSYTISNTDYIVSGVDVGYISINSNSEHREVNSYLITSTIKNHLTGEINDINFTIYLRS